MKNQFCGSGFIDSGSSILNESGSGYGFRGLMRKIGEKMQLKFFFFLDEKWQFTYRIPSSP
jgi:hypothetical protein